jgi:UDP-GlcNAc:undecaprenyl-phosphate GlcNAc-1-phosphate transferase
MQKAAFKWGIIDKPGGHKIHQKPTPLMGGVCVFLGFFLPLIMNGIFSTGFLVVLASASVLFILGIIDDVRSLPASWKLGVQVTLAFIITGYGIRVILLPEDWLALKFVNITISVVWIVGITNALNFLDGMDGLAAGLGAIISFFMAMVALRMNTPIIGWACLAMVGACVGFLPFNFKPGNKASIFLGDAGSTVIGFVLAVLAIYAPWAHLNPLVSLVSPLLIFGILIFDMCYITLSRIYFGHVRSFRQWIDYVGHDHLHHRFAEVLGGPARSVLFIYVLTICLGLNALLLPYVKLNGALILLGQSSLILVMVSILEGKYRIDHTNGSPSD